jgi:serine/threonine protein kinase
VVNYQIHKENFTKALNERSQELFRNPKRKQAIVLPNFKVTRVLSNTDLYIGAVLQNFSSGEFLFMRLVKKWNSYNSSIGNVRSFASVFQAFANPEDEHLVPVELILEHPAFLAVITPYYPLGSLFNCIYSVRVEKRTFSESAILKIAEQLLKTIQSVHAKNQVLMCIKPENVFLSSRKEVKLLHLSSNKLDFKGFVDNTITENVEYLPPELIKGDTEIGPGVDFWYLGILL